MTAAATVPLVLASTSRYRQELLARLHLAFAVAAPAVDETALPGEPPAATATRLAAAKARAVAARYPDALILGSDQVADCDGVAVSKPGDPVTARAQLAAQSGRSVVFHTAVALLNARTGHLAQASVDVVTRFRTLSAAEIDAYLALDQPWDCAGSMRSEGLGIALVDAITCDDPTALIGLPLITVARMLRAEGVMLPPTA
ncbi:MAG: septum formation protein Maf [Proteobacteria bacterium]|nr:septum formation protein Maf [Pseudomonadota bacterium]